MCRPIANRLHLLLKLTKCLRNRYSDATKKVKAFSTVQEFWQVPEAGWPRVERVFGRVVQDTACAVIQELFGNDFLPAVLANGIDTT